MKVSPEPLRSIYDRWLLEEREKVISVARESGENPQRLMEKVGPSVGYGEWVRMMAEIMVRKNKERMLRRFEHMQNEMDAFTVELESSMATLEATLKTFGDVQDETLRRLRASRMALTTEMKAVTSSISGISEAIGPDPESWLERLERVAEVAERLKAASEGGWLDKVIGLLVEGQE